MTTLGDPTTPSAALPIGPKPTPRRFHQARWDEPIVFELSVPGARGILPPATEPAISALVGDPAAALPPGIRRERPSALPELSQVHVVRHYDRLSQETLGADLNVDVGQGTCTMKYSPKVNDRLVRSPRIADLHPLQDPGTVQGVLEIMWRLEQFLAEISGMDRISLQPTSGSAAIWANISMVRAWHASRGEGFDAPGGGRDEVITTIFSHPSNAACAKVAGYRVVTLHPDESGEPDLAALRAAVSERTAALLITNPEDTGIFNPRIEEFVRVVHEAGGLASYDQANANGILGITRAGDAGFDLCHFNLHKTFSTPHGSGGPGAGACGVKAELARFLPRPTIERVGDRYVLDDDRPDSIGKVRPWFGVAPNLVRAYAWIMSLGADGLREVAETAVLNNNYLLAKVLADSRRGGAVCGGTSPDRAGPLQLGAADPGDRPDHGRPGPASRRFRDPLLDQPPPVRGSRADDAGADGVVLAGRPRRARRDPRPGRRRGVLGPGAGPLRAARQHDPPDRPGGAGRPRFMGGHLARLPAQAPRGGADPTV